jgi:hypothetical protein
MMQTIAYKLSEYKIIENVYGDLVWECHFGLGTLKNGKCFINGDILYLMPGVNAGPGFLKGEFLDHLNKLPKWGKTEYYCTSYKIYECKTGRIKPFLERNNNRLQDETILRENESIQTGVTKNEYKSIETYKSGDTSYKLNQYEIMKKNNDQLFWKSCSGLNNLNEGRCFINGSILFLESGETKQTGIRKGEFLQKLIQLPDWKETNYFCKSYAIYYSDTGDICRSLGKDKELREKVYTKNDSVSNKTHRTGIKLEPTFLNRIISKDKLKTFFIVCKILVILILKLLVGCFNLIRKVTRAIVEKLTRFRG